MTLRPTTWKGHAFTAGSRICAQDCSKLSKRPSLSMITFRVSYAPVHPGVWSVDTGDHVRPQFKSRVDALRFAIRAALKSEQDGATAFVAVEGIDGQWRMFDHAGKGIV